MARLCLACQTTMANHTGVCPTCGRNLAEMERAWASGHQAWHGYLEATGWYPGRRADWVEVRWAPAEPLHRARPHPPRRAVGRYLGGHPDISRPCRVTLIRDETAVMIAPPSWWPSRATRIVIPLASIRSVSLQRTSETSLDDAIVTAAIGGARTGPLGLAFGVAVGRRRRVVRSVHVRVSLSEAGETELVFRAADDHKVSGAGMVARIFDVSR